MLSFIIFDGFALFLFLCHCSSFVCSCSSKSVPLRQTTYRIGNSVCILLGMAEGRSVNIKNTYTHIIPCLALVYAVISRKTTPTEYLNILARSVPIYHCTVTVPRDTIFITVHIGNLTRLILSLLLHVCDHTYTYSILVSYFTFLLFQRSFLCSIAS